MTEKTTIDCGTHGLRPYALICTHLRQSRRRRYYASPACPHGPAQAWCVSCDALVARDRGWSDAAEAHADFQLYCTECYKQALRKHTFVSYTQGSDDTCDWSELGSPDE
jgi:hypothetical protein